MPHRIEITLKDEVRDPRGERIKREIEHFLHLNVEAVRAIDVYTVDAQLSPEELTRVAAGPFCDPVIQHFHVDQPAASGFDFLIEVGFRPGVTDNVGRTAGEAIGYLLGRPLANGEGVYTSVQYLISGTLSADDAEKIATGLLCNTLIQRYQILDAAGFATQGGVAPFVPKVQGEAKAEVNEIDFEVSD